MHVCVGGGGVHSRMHAHVCMGVGAGEYVCVCMRACVTGVL